MQKAAVLVLQCSFLLVPPCPDVVQQDGPAQLLMLPVDSLLEEGLLLAPLMDLLYVLGHHLQQLVAHLGQLLVLMVPLLLVKLMSFPS